MRKALLLSLLLALAAGYVGCAVELLGPEQQTHQVRGGDDVDDT
ncbi:MAG: hypothetical protein N2561_01030 [Bacteroidetes bacterium]|nr:hypothetical protein [Rhodothermia bacterium]MCS7155790.1 hypothetical protein [Bacteroidota bacterium]MCX7906109.1 hypothetical protein [Bacteroidota bacterium]MDW8138237.1 hypothetical protein [Bacteroidota bacterium]MDW8285921.1 hypothetical protein [Bacteroidota bacterium]